jgi:hypothetical protein
MQKQKENEFKRASVEYKEFVKGKDLLKDKFNMQLLVGMRSISRNSLLPS